jgi:hypothetical protein
MELPHNKSHSLDSALDTLKDGSQAIKRREGVRPNEEKRIQEALTLLTGGEVAKPLGAKSAGSYLDFLRKVYNIAGLPMRQPWDI